VTRGIGGGSLALMVILGAAIVTGGCGAGGGAGPTQSDHGVEGATATTSGEQRAAAPNACPTEGCQVRIVSVGRAGRELRIGFSANFTPDVSRNHFHVYWDTYTSKQVSFDAKQRFGVEQGFWVPTADNPFTTADELSVRTRKNATRICVTAGDRYHNVIDPEKFDCRDVGALL
jgi:hypothetical protein